MKHKFTATLPLALLAIGALGSVTSVNADLNNSIYVPLDAPCRVGDTRNLTPQRVPAGDHVEWFAYGTDMSSQGGEDLAAGGCPQPKPDNMTPTGIAVNITAYGPQATGRGNLVAYPADAVTAPTASIVNYYPIPAIPNPSIANSTFVGLCQEAPCDGKFKIQANNSAVPVIADVQGYFYAQPSGIAHVAMRGGDYSSPVDAMNDLGTWCGTPGALNPCLMKIAPGVYDLRSENITMRSFVSIQGSGVEATTITGALGGADFKTSALVLGADHAALTDLKILNAGDSRTRVTGIYNDDASPFIQRVAVIVAVASGGISAYGIRNEGGSEPTITDVTVDVSAGRDSNYGIDNDHAKAIMKRVAVVAKGGLLTRGVTNDAAEVVMEDVSVIAKEARAANTAVHVNQSTVSMINVDAAVDGSGFGVVIAGPGSKTDIRNAKLVGKNNGRALEILADNPQTRIAYSMISGGVENQLPNSVKLKEICRGNYDENLANVDCSTKP